MDMQQQIAAQVKQMIVERLEVPAIKITSTAKLRDDLGIDSFGLVEVAFEIKDKFDVQLTDEDFKSLIVFDDAVSCIMRKLKEK